VIRIIVNVFIAYYSCMFNVTKFESEIALRQAPRLQNGVIGQSCRVAKGCFIFKCEPMLL
jgi:hypothetical protein